MCLVPDRILTQEIMENGPEEMTCYKVIGHFNVRHFLFWKEKKLFSPYRYYKWRPGINKAKRNDDPYAFTWDRGIHVFIREEDAEYFCGDSKEHYAVVKVQCKKEHLISMGKCDYSPFAQAATFSQVTLDQEEYDRILKKEV